MDSTLINMVSNLPKVAKGENMEEFYVTVLFGNAPLKKIHITRESVEGAKLYASEMMAHYRLKEATIQNSSFDIIAEYKFEKWA